MITKRETDRYDENPHIILEKFEKYNGELIINENPVNMPIKKPKFNHDLVRLIDENIDF